MLRVHVEEAADAELATTLDELVAEGARRMLAAALEAEVDAYLTGLHRRAGRTGPPSGGPQRACRVPGRWSPERARSRSGPHGWTTAGSTR